MKKFVINEDIAKEELQQVDLISQVKKRLMTTDMQAAIAAGCNVEILTQQTETGVKIVMRTKEKVSMLRSPDGKIVSVLVDRT